MRARRDQIIEPAAKPSHVDSQADIHSILEQLQPIKAKTAAH
jgi:hypothetical protein